MDIQPDKLEERAVTKEGAASDAAQATVKRDKPNYNRSKQKQRPQKRMIPPLPYSAELLAKPTTELGLSEQTLSVLQKGGLDTLGKIAARTPREMYSVQFFNKKNLFEVVNALKAFGVELRPEPKPADNTDKKTEKPPVSDNKAKQRGNGSEGKMPERGGRPNGKNPPDNDSVEKKSEKITSDRSDKTRERKPVRDFNDKSSEKGKSEGKGNSTKEAQSTNNKDNSKKRKADNSFDIYRIFPREPFVPTPPVFPNEDEFVKFQRGGKWGYKNKQNKEVIPPIYDEVFAFKEGIACVERKGLFGFINRENELIIPYKYECASSFSEGLACVSLHEKCGYINTKDEVVVPFVYDAGTAFSGKTAKVKQNGRWGTYSLETAEVNWAN